MRVLIAPLNWGLGHASRCIPLVQQYILRGDDVVLGGDGDSLTLLRKHFPKLPFVQLAPLNLRYSKGNSQVMAMIKAMPQLIDWSIHDHVLLKRLLSKEHFDLVISDNRFGLYSKDVRSVYITHQLWIRLPKGWHWLEKLVHCLHARVYDNYKEVWVPDTSDHKLSGWLSTDDKSNSIQFIGPLSRFNEMQVVANTNYDIVAVLSGLEPQRGMWEDELIKRFGVTESKVLIIEGKVAKPMTQWHRGNITITPYMMDEQLAAVLIGAQKIIARSGYSTIMDLAVLGVLNKAELTPTPGQPEQEYLAQRMGNH